MLGIPVHDANSDSIIINISEAMESGRRCRILYANAHQSNIARGDEELQSCFNEAELVVCDGYGMALAIYALHGVWPSRQTPPDWIDALASLASDRGWRVFLLGSSEASCSGTAEALVKRNDKLLIAGTQNGYFDKVKYSSENQQIIQLINSSHTNILIVGFGSPLQEQWIWENFEDLDCQIIIAVGAMYDYVSGQSYRAPRWVTDYGLEWASRLVTEPRRLWRRYLLGLPLFAYRVAVARARRQK